MLLAARVGATCPRAPTLWRAFSCMSAVRRASPMQVPSATAVLRRSSTLRGCKMERRALANCAAHVVSSCRERLACSKEFAADLRVATESIKGLVAAVWGDKACRVWPVLPLLTGHTLAFRGIHELASNSKPHGVVANDKSRLGW
eukprot:503694-Amphidinium_carterae.1